ncbi:threonine-phosphate decarboxylase CobD [Priestia flexa]|uniref:threonine-phosphate decarboxylase CobD n=1 Tax=Priestia flexa TaxID=86664 RepID=UPI000E67E23F|nr:threonine-phosphate decarboxylase CobD [Priestia flexa]RIV11218.1 threonine-phosphate decarboxylase [Priestia flexa]
MALPTHGANPAIFLEAIGQNAERSFIDFSVNTNPLGAPNIINENWDELREIAFSYPDPDVKKLTSLIATYHKLTSNEVLVTNGAAEAFFLLSSIFSNEKVGILQPTFIEYEQASLAHGCEIIHISLEETDNWNWNMSEIKQKLPILKAIWICHPNNPTGRMYDINEWEELIDLAHREKTYLVVDEAFIDFVKGAFSFDRWIQKYPYLIIVRSMTKMFNIAGVRLGYVLAHQGIITKLMQKQPPWSVNGMAQQIGRWCLSEVEFVNKTVEYIDTERKRVTNELQKLGFTISQSATNYYLCSIPESYTSAEWLSFLAQEGIVARHTENFLGLNGRYVRLAVKTQAENDQLISVLKKGVGLSC